MKKLLTLTLLLCAVQGIAQSKKHKKSYDNFIYTGIGVKSPDYISDTTKIYLQIIDEKTVSPKWVKAYKVKAYANNGWQIVGDGISYIADDKKTEIPRNIIIKTTIQ